MLHGQDYWHGILWKFGLGRFCQNWKKFYRLKKVQQSIYFQSQLIDEYCYSTNKNWFKLELLLFYFEQWKWINLHSDIKKHSSRKNFFVTKAKKNEEKQEIPQNQGQKRNPHKKLTQKSPISLKFLCHWKQFLFPFMPYIDCNVFLGMRKPKKLMGYKNMRFLSKNLENKLKVLRIGFFYKQHHEFLENNQFIVWSSILIAKYRS